MEKLIDNRIRTYIIDKDPGFLSICKIIVGESEHFKIVGSSSHLKNKLMFTDLNVELILIDVTNFSQLEYDTLFDIKKQVNSEVGILAMSSIMDQSLLKYLKIGLAGFINKSSKNIAFELTKSLCDIYNNRIALSNEVSRIIVESFRRSLISCPLTNKEVEVVNEASKGKTYATISKDLSISIETTKSHFRNIYHKLGVSSKSEAISVATSNKWV